MANSYFKFKQFTVQQDLAAMKVGTDGVLLGAWANIDDCQSVLDVGTGTGLIALMMAQRNKQLKITAVEIDNDAAAQAVINFDNSKWANRLSVTHTSLQKFVEQSDRMYDAVISNPPYFKQSFKSGNTARDLARHTDSLSYQELIVAAYKLTNDNGSLSLVIPYDAEQEVITIAANNGFFTKRILRVKPTPSKGFVRALLEFSKHEISECSNNELIIEDKGRHQYSEAYKELTKDFYLAF